MKRFTYTALVVLCILTMAVQPAYALRMYNATNENQQVFNDADPHLIDLGNAFVGEDVGDTWQVDIKKNTRVVIIFSAECSVDAADTRTWIDLDILVDGVAVPPTNSDNAFWTSNGNDQLDSWGTPSVNCMVELEPGLHTFQVQGTLKNFSDGERWRIDDTSLTLIVQKR